MNRTPTRARFFTGYLVVLAVMLGWWLLLQALTQLDAPGWTVLGAYAAPFAVWGLVVVVARKKT